MNFTEQDSNYLHLDQMSTLEILTNINKEDSKVASCIATVFDTITPLVNNITAQIKKGGRLFYIGAGTSGRLGVVDASECPPTFGVKDDVVIGIIAGGDKAIRKSQEFAEDDVDQAWKDLNQFSINEKDVVVGIAASGTTPYVVFGLKTCQEHNILTACITSNLNTPLSEYSDYPIEVITGPEFLTGSTRMKAGTAQKLVLNMISTSVMIKLGYVKGNKMVDMQLSNNKLVDRGTKLIVQSTKLHYDKAKALLLKMGSVRKALEAFESK